MRTLGTVRCIDASRCLTARARQQRYFGRALLLGATLWLAHGNLATQLSKLTTDSVGIEHKSLRSESERLYLRRAFEHLHSSDEETIFRADSPRTWSITRRRTAASPSTWCRTFSSTNRSNISRSKGRRSRPSTQMDATSLLHFRLSAARLPFCAFRLVRLDARNSID